MTELEKKVQLAAQMYYTSGTSDITDEEFDALVDQLKIEVPDSILFKVGWGYDVDKDNTPGMKRKHTYTTIGSLDKCHDLKELGSDFLDIPVDASTKLDGLSIVLYYEHGLLKYALTRGDSFTGVDVTDKVLAINPIFAMTKIPSFTGAVRGEAVMSYSNFEKFKELHPEAKNPRNSTAGLINGKDVFDDLKFLDIVVYTIIYDEVYHDFDILDDDMTTVSAHREMLSDMFAPYLVVPYCTISIPNRYDFSDKQFIEMMNDLKSKLYTDYPADGIVLTKNFISCDHGKFMYDAKAFKFAAESKITRIIDIEWNMSKTKNCVPRVLLEPIQLSGTTVQACAGYHAQYIKENNLGPNSIVEVRKSGEIIPQIIKIHQSTEAHLPDTCPECGHPLYWVGVNLVCENKECSNSIEQDLLMWLQNLVPTDFLGDTLKMKFLNQLVENGNIEDTSIESVMRCKLHLSEDTPSTQFNNFASMWNRLHEDTVKFDLVHALIACNIPRIGDLTAIKFAKYPARIQEILDIQYEGEFPLCELILEIGEANAHSVLNHYKKLQRLNLIRDRIIWRVESKVEFKGKVAITGKLSVKRSEFENELRRNGYEPTDTINKDVKFLVTDNPAGQSSKNLKASKLGVPKITEYEFRLKYMN